jgi:hypothetical protein
MKKSNDAYEIFLLSQLAAPILIGIGAYILANYIFGDKLVFSIPVAVIIGALGVSVPTTWFWYLRDQRESTEERTADREKRFLPRLGMFLLIGLCLLIALLFVYHGLQVRNLLLIVLGFLSALFCSLVLVFIILRGLGLQTDVLISAVVGFVIVAGLSAFIFISSQVEVASACSGRGVAAAAAYSEGPGSHPVEVLYFGRRIWNPMIPTTWYSPIPESWRPASVEETELVACVDSVEKYVIEICQYRGGPDITRYGYRRQVTLVTARTGEVVASETFRGEPPRQCNQFEDSSIGKLTGSKLVDPDEVWQWLGGYVDSDQDYQFGADAEQPRPEVSIEAPQPMPSFSPESTSPELSGGPEEPSLATASPDSQLVVTPGSQPPVTGVLTGNPSLWSGPRPGGEHLGIILEEGESVEILASTDEWIRVRWVSPEGTEVTGWVQRRWVEIPTPDTDS